MPTETVKREPDQEKEVSELEVVLEELGKALESKDYSMAAEAFKAAFEICESYPHEEYGEE